ncbi:MAG: O-antigen ligase [Planctomycetales bacterium]|nr:O-antigen ligase [Planctomycetales bacterium]
MDGSVGVSALPAFSLLMVVIGIIAIHCQRDIRQLVSARNVFLLTIMAWFLLEACLLPDAVLKYSQGAHLMGLLSVFLCIGSFLAAYHSTKGGLFDSTFKRLVSIESPRLIWGVFLFAVFVGFLPLMVIAKGNVLLILEDAFMSRGRWSSIFQRGRFGGVRDAFLELQLFLRAALPLAAAIMVQKKQGHFRKLVVVLFLTYMSFRAINDGTRSKVIEVFLPLAAAIYWRFSPSLKQKALLFGLPTLMILGFLWSAASVIGRNEGRLDWEGALEADYVGFEMFRELLYLQKVIPDKSPYQFGHTYLVQVVNPIPRFLWPGKPSGDAGLLMAELQDTVAQGADLTVSPGLIGEMYWNGGLPGILFVSVFLGYVAKSWDRARPLAQQSILAFTVFAAGLAIIFVSGRSINMSTAYGMLGLYVILILFSRKGRRVVPVARGSVIPTPGADRNAPELRLPGSR